MTELGSTSTFKWWLPDGSYIGFWALYQAAFWFSKPLVVLGSKINLLSIVLRQTMAARWVGQLMPTTPCQVGWGKLISIFFAAQVGRCIIVECQVNARETGFLWGLSQTPDVLDLVFLPFFSDEFFNNNGSLYEFFLLFSGQKRPPNMFFFTSWSVLYPEKTHGTQPWPSSTGSHPKIYIQPPEQPLKAAVVARVGGKNLWVSRGVDGVPSGYGTGCYGSHGLLIDDLLVKHGDYP